MHTKKQLFKLGLAKLKIGSLYLVEVLCMTNTNFESALFAHSVE